MSSPILSKRAASCVGRVGTLAAALGVSAAVLTGTGVAWADTEQSGPDRGAAGTSSRSTPDQTGPTDTGDSAVTTRRTARGGNLPPARAATPQQDVVAPTTRRESVSIPAAAAVAEKNDNPADLVRAGMPRTEANDVNPIGPQRVPMPSAATQLSVAPVAAAVDSPADSPKITSLVSVPVVAAAPATADGVEATAVAPAPASQTVAPSGLVSRLLAAIGLTGPGAGGSPAVPTETPALWALLALARRESGRTLRSGVAQTLQPVPAATVTAAAVTAPKSLASSHIGWVTGQRNNAIPGLGWPQTNNTSWAGVYGTDLGIMWFNGENGLTQLAFGDTFSGPNMTGDWRSNVLLLSDDTQLYNGLSLINTGYAYQFIPAARDAVFFIGSEVTNIPSSAVYANGENYVNYFSVKSWDTPGRWTTNYSAISMYDPATDKWVLQRSTIRSAGWFRSSTPYVAGGQNFQQMAYVLQPEDQVAPGETRYLYAFGTPAGRAGSAYLSRVPETAITDLGQYEYWDGSTWVRDKPAVAAPVIGDSPNSTGLVGCIIDLANNPNFFGGWFAGFTGAKTGGNVSEMSVQYNEYLDKYVVMYGDGLNNMQLRTADTPEGPWSDPIQVASSFQYPGLYAPMIHPLSGTGQLTDASGDPDVSTLYWNMSLWGNYNVVLMKTDLTPLAPVTTQV
ncbi:MAG TPA: DUF4185 domain-containing protein [Mycobacterium sp.]|nr:DUF4185 domain-containing protein [Mycobacterium sp.]